MSGLQTEPNLSFYTGTEGGHCQGGVIVVLRSYLYTACQSATNKPKFVLTNLNVAATRSRN